MVGTRVFGDALILSRRDAFVCTGDVAAKN